MVGAANAMRAVRQMTGLHELRARGGMTWIAQERGWVGAPDEIVRALSQDGFDECKREMTTSRRDCRPVGGVWQGVNPQTKSVASVIWVSRPALEPAMVFLEIDGEMMASPGRGPER